MSHSVVIVAGGSGSRFGLKKQFLDLLGIPVLKRAVSCFKAHRAINRIVIVVPEEDMPHAQELFLDATKNIIVTKGGSSRQESVMNGLNCIQGSRCVLIHDGVRPFVTEDLISRVIDGLAGVEGCIPAIAVIDTLKEVHNDLVTRTIQRENIYQVQTPQAFVMEALVEAYDRAIRQGGSPMFTDDSAMLEASGKRVRVVEGDPFNMKITYKDDMLMAEAILRCRIGSA